MTEKRTLKDIENALQGVDGIAAGDSHEDAEIMEAEKALDVTLPDSFKAYLKKWGKLALGPIEYYGLTKNPNFTSAGVPNFVWFTLKKRDQVNLPKNLIVFQNANDEAYYCIDTSSLIDGECKVAIWNNLERQTDQILDIGFFDFLLGDIEEHIDMMG